MKGILGILLLSGLAIFASSTLQASPPADEIVVVVQPTYDLSAAVLPVTIPQPREVVLMAAAPAAGVCSITPHTVFTLANRMAYLAADRIRAWNNGLFTTSAIIHYQHQRSTAWLYGLREQQHFNKRGSYQDQLLFYKYKPLRYHHTIPCNIT